MFVVLCNKRQYAANLKHEEPASHQDQKQIGNLRKEIWNNRELPNYLVDVYTKGSRPLEEGKSCRFDFYCPASVARSTSKQAQNKT